MNDELLEEVTLGMQILFEGINAIQKYERIQARRKALRTNELLRRRKKLYDGAYEDAERKERTVLADQPYELRYNEVSGLLVKVGLPSLISDNPEIKKARNMAGVALYDLIAKFAKIQASRKYDQTQES